MTRTARLFTLFLLLLCCTPPVLRAQEEPVDYEADVAFALDEIEARCKGLLRVKDIDWDDVRKEFTKASRKVEDHGQHFELLIRLIARVRDGHATVEKRELTKDLPWPTFGQENLTGCGLFLCRIDGDIFIKNAWADAGGSGLASGMEILKIDKTPIDKWLDQRVESFRDFRGFSTDQHAFFWVCHRGMMDEAGTRMDIEYKDLKGRKKKRTITYARANHVPWGPAFFPPNLESTDDVNYGLLESGNAYVHVRRCKSSVVSQIDTALAVVAGAPGMVLDFRGNSGGGFDHAAFLGRFVPKGEKLQVKSTIPSAGNTVYGGPIIVIVDATVVSAGETGSGQFKEEGRAYVIGESNTAGMSSQKTTIELPSGLFGLYVSTHSNKSWFNNGKGLEGVGLIPHEYVEFDPEDLANEIDTLIVRAEELLADYPQKEVPFDPAKYGWGEE